MNSAGDRCRDCETAAGKVTRTAKAFSTGRQPITRQSGIKGSREGHGVSGSVKDLVGSVEEGPFTQPCALFVFVHA